MEFSGICYAIVIAAVLKSYGGREISRIHIRYSRIVFTSDCPIDVLAGDFSDR